MTDQKILTQDAFNKFIKDKTITISIDTSLGGPKGTKVKVDSGWSPFYTTPNAYICKIGSSSTYIYMNQCTFGEQSMKVLEQSIVDNNATIARLQEENELTIQKITFMNENKIDTYDDDLFKVFEILNALEKKGGSKMEKALAISKIIKG